MHIVLGELLPWPHIFCGKKSLSFLVWPLDTSQLKLAVMCGFPFHRRALYFSKALWFLVDG